jgi:hypothetical protein
MGEAGQRVRCRGVAELEALQGREAHRQECLCHLGGAKHLWLEVLCYPRHRQECRCYWLSRNWRGA